MVNTAESNSMHKMKELFFRCSRGVSRTARWIRVPRGAHQTVRQPRPESLDTGSHQTGGCFLGHLTIRCRMQALVLFAMMHQLCNDGHYNDLWMGRRLTDSRLVAAVQLVSAGRTPGRWYARLALRMAWTRKRAISWLPSPSLTPPNRRRLAPLRKGIAATLVHPKE